MKKITFLIIILGLFAFASTVFASTTEELQPAHDIEYTETVIVPSIKIGAQGVGGVTFFNGTIVNATTTTVAEAEADNPVTFGDNVRIDGRAHRGATAGPEEDGSTPFIIDDNLEVAGTIEGTGLIGTSQLTTSNSGSSGQVLSLNSNGVLTWADDATGTDSTGDITAVTAGSGLSGGGTSGNVSLTVSGITSAMITDGAVGNADLSSNSVTTGKIANGTIVSGDISDDTIDFSKIADSPDLDANLNIENATLFVGRAGGSYDGMIGVGTATPTSSIQVADYINFDNTGDLRLTALGFEAGDSMANDALKNTLVGFQAGNGITSGDDNTAIGNNTLGAAATSSNNTAIGSGALASNTDPNNTAVGFNALTTNTEGTEVTAVGSTALDANSTGDNNTAMGYNALGENNTGTDNTAIGHGALDVNTGAANYNTAVGGEALGANTNGDHNTAVGYDALNDLDNTSSNRNTAVGALAMDNATNAVYNTAVGYNALGGVLSTSNNNIAIGYMAGDNITTGDTNIIIGSNVDASAVGVSNELNIGGAIFGDLSGAIATPVAPTEVFEVQADSASEYAGFFFNDGNNANRYGLKVQAGADDGAGTNKMITFFDGDGTEVGDIKNESGTISITAFTAGHNGSIPEDKNESGYRYGTIMSVKKVTENLEKPNQPDYYIEPSNEPYADNIFGVYASKYEEKENLHSIYALGDGHVLVTDQNGGIEAGDRITSSSISGLGMKADRPGTILGIALESWEPSQSSEYAKLPNGEQVKVGKLAVSYYPGTYYSGTEDILDVKENGKVAVKDENGNVTDLSPHDAETGEWVYYSKNTKTGRVLKIEMEDLIFDLAEDMSEKTGKEYIKEYYE